MKPNQIDILKFILAAVAEIESMPPVRTEHGHPGYVAARIARDDLPKFGVRIGGSWLGSSPAGRQARHRALVVLEENGFVTTSLFAKRVTHVQLTAEGRKLAERLSLNQGDHQLGTSMVRTPTGSDTTSKGPERLPDAQSLTQDTDNAAQAKLEGSIDA